MRWSSESDLSGDESDGEMDPHQATTGGSRAAMEARNTSQPHCSADPPTMEEIDLPQIQIHGPPKKKRGIRKRRSRRQSRLLKLAATEQVRTAAVEMGDAVGAAAPRGHIPAHRRLGDRADDRRPVG